MSHPTATRRTAVLVDVQNLYYSLRRVQGPESQCKIDYDALLTHAVDDNTTLVRALAYVTRRDSSQDSFLSALNHIGFETKITHISEKSDGPPDANRNVEITIDALALADKVDTIILCTGDGSLQPLCDRLRTRGVRVEIFGVGGSISNKLSESADSLTDILTNLQKYLLTPTAD